MKFNNQTTMFLLILLLLIAGCVTKSQQVTPAIPATDTTPAIPAQTNAVYVPSSQLPIYQQQAHDTVNAAIPLAATVYPPAVVFQPVANTLIDSIFGAVAAISAALAAFKTKQAASHKKEAQDQKSAAAALASAVITNPTAMQVAVQNAASNKSTVLVQDHLASANSPT